MVTMNRNAVISNVPGIVNFSTPTIFPYQDFQIVSDRRTEVGLYPFASEIEDFPAAGLALIVLNNQDNGFEPWVTDGTTDGTFLLADIQGTRDWPGYAGGKMYFAADDGMHGIELFATDGTTEGTALVKDILPGPKSSQPRNFETTEEMQGLIFFTANDENERQRLYKSDGTAEGTVQVSSEARLRNSFFALQGIGTKVLFGAQDNNEQQVGLWVSDGTEEGTVLLRELPGRPNRLSDPIGGLMYFSVLRDTISTYVTDGTIAGTRLLRHNISVGDSTRAIESSSTGLAIFVDYHNYLLWATDGTPAGTRVVQTPQPFDNAIALFPVGGKAYCCMYYQDAVTNAYSVNIVETDGTDEGTKVVGVSNLLDLSADPTLETYCPCVYGLAILPNGALAFELWREIAEIRELFVVDPMANKAYLLASFPIDFRKDSSDIVVVNGYLITPGYLDGVGTQLYRFDVSSDALPTASPVGSGCSALDSIAFISWTSIAIIMLL